MPEDRIKSAWEIAMERVERLGKMSPEELRKKNRQERMEKGLSLATKYLAGASLRDLLLDLDKHGSEEKDDIKDGIVSGLLAAVELSDPERAKRAADGIAGLAGIAEAEKAARDVEALLDEYVAVKKLKLESSREDLEREARRTLEREGIGGPAVAPNLALSAFAAALTEDLSAQYSSRLEESRSRLARG